MSIAEIIATYQDLGVSGILIAVVVFVGRHLMKQNKDCYDSYQDHVTQHKDEIKGLTNHVMTIVDENTKANTALAKSIEHLDASIKSRTFQS